MKELFKDILQESLQAELNETFAYAKHEISGNANSRNGYSKKTIKSKLASIYVNIICDLNGEF